MLIAPDLIINLVLELLHFVWEILAELAHTVFEGIETILDNIIEELFQTELHQTQVIAFYIMMSFMLPTIYLLLRLLLRKVMQLKNALYLLIMKLDINQYSHYWHNISIQKKTSLFCSSLIVIYLVSFLFM
jgi:hypothetical protein